ncbi:hypothetical protein Nepgr_017689 [Nepenthes gracilis]|uniref:1,3-beta-glucan synthase n=1 Tax=Nepenthes gracilis TaxID=150966 RepID=A0AAD3SQV2_NEPGR|nr:hypothetical protein Nepgr_017689 [Nepenthes gracilis]
MNLRQRQAPTRLYGDGYAHAPLQQQPRPPLPPQPPARASETFNIIPIHDLLVNHPSQRYPEVRAVASALRSVDDLRKPPFYTWNEGLDLLDWLGLFFGFQNDNVRNQREHLVLHLANSQMRLNPPPKNPAVLDPSLLRRFRRKLLSNYAAWCAYIGKRSSVRLSTFRRNTDEFRRELLYVCLYLLIWGESANLRFLPECICYIFHHMAHELNLILDDHVDVNTGSSYVPWINGENSFLNNVVRPIYDTIRDEVRSSRNGTKPHSAWRNYDDLNEYFWSRRCFRTLKWPLDLSSNFFSTTRKELRVGKTGFVEQRTFWNVFRSFDRVWVLLVLSLQAMIIVAWEGTDAPWKALERRTVQVKLLTVFITWGGLRLLQSILDAGTQYSLVSRETIWLGVRMMLKSMVAVAWIIVFSVFYARIWRQKNKDGIWSDKANQQIFVFLKAALVFVFPELLALVLFILPWIRNVIEEANWPVLYFLTWWFHTRIFVGRGVREGLISNIKYSFFWILVLAAKFSFSYFLQIKPLVTPTQALLDLEGPYNWHEFFGSTNRVAVLFLWLPVVIIYLMDVQIWYSIFSSIAGATVGLFSHLGEIRNTEQLRLRFQFFASAMQFNLMPEEQPPNAPVITLVNKLRDAVQRLRLRYGLGQPYKTIEFSQIEAMQFALIWNEINITMREEDLLSDKELEFLKLPPNCWDIRVIRWPCVLLCNELLLSLNQAKEMPNGPDRRLWQKICKSEYRRCAVIEAYDSIKYVLLHIVEDETKEYSIVMKFFREMDHHIETGKVTETYDITLLPLMHEKVVTLIQLLLKPEKDMSALVNVLQALYEISVRDFPKDKKLFRQIIAESFAPAKPSTNSGNLFENAVKFPEEDNFFYRQLQRLLTILTSRDAMQDVPKNREARRRIAFFSNSLFMNMPHAPHVEKMMSFSVLTPYYNEDVMYGSVPFKHKTKTVSQPCFIYRKFMRTSGIILWNG